jgi:hypothetical protein
MQCVTIPEKTLALRWRMLECRCVGGCWKINAALNGYASLLGTYHVDRAIPVDALSPHNITDPR